MARRLFFVDEVKRGAAHVRGEQARHLARVLRAAPGERCEISDNQSRYLAEIEAAHKDEITFRVIEQLAPDPECVRVTLLASLIKFDRFEWILEKATELGVASIVPVEAERSEKGLRQAAAKRIERWRRILLEASQQSRRMAQPRIWPAAAWAEAMGHSSTHRFFLDENPGAPALISSLPELRRSSDEAALLVGPEGGWTERERDEAARAGWVAASLGTGVLRAETAAMAAVAVLVAAWHAGSR